MHKTSNKHLQKIPEISGWATEVPGKETSRHRIIKGEKIENNIYKITDISERFQNTKPRSNLAVMGRCILTPDIFDRIDETEYGIGGEIHLTDALSKLDSLYGAVFEGKSYYIESRLDWLKASIEFGLDDEEFREELVRYMGSYTEK